jgi:deoxyribodipyrimidine photo-lyase
MKKYQNGLVWLRRDLRLSDHSALEAATKECNHVYLCFVFDQDLTERLKKEQVFFNTEHTDQRLGYIYSSLCEIEQSNVKIIIRYGHQVETIEKICLDYKIDKLFFNRDYEPRAKARDLSVIERINHHNIDLQHFCDSVILEHHEVRNGSGEVYKVFTPYKNKWLEVFEASRSKKLQMRNPDLSKLCSSVLKDEIPLDNKLYWEERCGIKFCEPSLPPGRKRALSQLESFKQKAIDHYDKQRDFPATEGTSLLSVSIRHGVISIREMVQTALSKSNSSGSRIWLSELIWREFYQMLLDTHPHVVKGSFKPQYDKIQWMGDQQNFKSWCQGQTGYPIVDAAMRCLNQTGQMHNRLRMIVGSFLCKTLLIDWRLGERYFALKLLDFDLAANNGGWQWCSSSGCDAQPYFRIFNPTSQSQKFDGDGEYIKLWCPELRELDKKAIHEPLNAPPLSLAQAGVILGEDYPYPIVDYKKHRQLALEMYQVVKSS